MNEKLKELKDNSVDSVVTDPPYEIGFMGKGWDDSGIANNPELWKEVLRVLKPGGHLLSFSHSRTYHRQAVAVEDAGFEIRDQIMWIYGSGFPKSHNIGKSVDKLLGNEREVIGSRKLQGTTLHEGNFRKNHDEIDLTKGNNHNTKVGELLLNLHTNQS
jgi:DNA modification methylase